jgi:thiol:disulfide interchange protein DsbD
LFFAASFLGAFEIMLPNSWANKVDSQEIEEELGFFYGIGTCNCFSCTGPIVVPYWLKLLLKELHPSLGCSVFIGISFTLYAFRYVPRMVEFHLNQADG